MSRYSKKQLAKRLANHLDQLATLDRDIKRGLQAYGYPEPRLRERGFEVFLHTIVSQQISVHAAEAIWGRLLDRFGENGSITATKLVKCREATLRRAGLSARKAAYAKGLAIAVENGSFKPNNLSRYSSEKVIEQITALKGFGIWSAEIYLMFSLQREDIFPADDLALRVSLQKLKSLDERPDAEEARTLIEHWAPFRSAGSLFLWHHYHCLRAARGAKR